MSLRPVHPTFAADCIVAVEGARAVSDRMIAARGVQAKNYEEQYAAKMRAQAAKMRATKMGMIS